MIFHKPNICCLVKFIDTIRYVCIKFVNCYNKYNNNTDL